LRQKNIIFSQKKHLYSFISIIYNLEWFSIIKYWYLKKRRDRKRYNTMRSYNSSFESSTLFEKFTVWNSSAFLQVVLLSKSVLPCRHREMSSMRDCQSSSRNWTCRVSRHPRKTSKRWRKSWKGWRPRRTASTKFTKVLSELSY